MSDKVVHLSVIPEYRAKVRACVRDESSANDRRSHGALCIVKIKGRTVTN